MSRNSSGWCIRKAMRCWSLRMRPGRFVAPLRSCSMRELKPTWRPSLAAWQCIPTIAVRGVGKLLMEARIEHVKDRIHVGIVENRCAHTYSQRISHRHGFVPVGFLPMKLFFPPPRKRCAVLSALFQCAGLRKNNPRIIPEVYPIAEMALRNCGSGLRRDCGCGHRALPAQFALLNWRSSPRGDTRRCCDFNAVESSSARCTDRCGCTTDRSSWRRDTRTI